MSLLSDSRGRLVAVAFVGSGVFFGPLPANAAPLSGVVRAASNIERPARIKIAVDAHACADKDRTVADPRLVIGKDRGLSDVVVTVVNPPDGGTSENEGKARTDAELESPLLDQERCRFLPHVVLLEPGQKLHVKNSDKILHTFRTLTEQNRPVNKAQIGGKVDVLEFAESETFRAECDVHHWMSSVIVVKAHRFVTVTDEAGKFAFDDLPEGSYELEFSHQTLGTQKATVAVDGDGGLLELEWPAPKKEEPETETNSD